MLISNLLKHVDSVIFRIITTPWQKIIELEHSGDVSPELKKRRKVTLIAEYSDFMKYSLN